MTPPFRSAGATDAGAVRPHNEDSFLDRPETGLWAVADGAGGHAAGEVASSLVREVLAEIPAGLPAGRLLGEVRERLSGAHAALLERRTAPDGGTSAATVVVLIAHGGHFACLWAGDSRLYLLRGGALRLVTRDHSLVQEMVAAGVITPAEAEGHPRANVITRAVGGGEGALELEKVTEPLEPGDRFLLCSDGLCKALPEAEIAALLAMPGSARVPEMLVAAALARQAADNVTAVTVEAVAGG